MRVASRAPPRARSGNKFAGYLLVLRRIRRVLFQGRTRSAEVTRVARQRGQAVAPSVDRNVRPHGALRLRQWLREPDENTFRATDIAESVQVVVIDDLIDDRRAKPAEPQQRVVKVVDGKHDSQVPP